MFNYAKTKATVNGLISKFGGAVSGVTLVQESASPIWNATTEEYDVQTLTTTAIQALKMNSETGVENGTVIESDMLMFLASPDVAPSMTDKIGYNGHNHTIVRIIETKPADTVLMYKVIVRR